MKFKMQQKMKLNRKTTVRMTTRKIKMTAKNEIGDENENENKKNDNGKFARIIYVFKIINDGVLFRCVAVL